MKFFSLLSGKDLRAKPGKKVIPEAEISELMSSAQIIEKVKEDAHQYRLKIVKECEILKEHASQEGFNEILLKLNQHVLSLNELLKTVEKDVHNKILPLALKAARKIIGEELKLHPDRIVDIVLQALKPVLQHHRVTIYVNKADLETLESKKSKIRKILEQVESFSIQERNDIEPGGCIIETESGIINAQLENQWRALESAFETFMKK